MWKKSKQSGLLSCQALPLLPDLDGLGLHCGAPWCLGSSEIQPQVQGLLLTLEVGLEETHPGGGGKVRLEVTGVS